MCNLSWTPHSSLEKDNSLNHSCVSPKMGYPIQTKNYVRKDYTPLHVYLGCVWVVIYVKYIAYEGLLHNTLALDVDTVQEANSRLTHEKALCEWFRNLSKRNVVRATAALVELNSDWLNRFTRTRGSGLGHPDWVIAKHSK